MSNSGSDIPDIDSPTVLSAQDAAALEALIEAEFVVEKVSSEHRQRAQRMAGLLGMLEAPVQSEGEAAARRRAADALARIARVENEDAPASEPDATLTPLDEDALEALVGSGYDPRRVAHSIRERARRHAGLLALLDGPRQDDMSAQEAARHASRREALVRKTLAAVEQDRLAPATLKFPQEVISAAGRGRWNFRMADLVSIAAMLTLVTAVVWPMLATMRDRGRQTACAGNLAGIGSAFGLYAGSSKDALPQATKSLAGTQWWNVGRPEQSNSANLFTLVRQKFSTPAAMACVGNADACLSCPEGSQDWMSLPEVSYSYQNLFSRHRPTWGQSPTMVILVDRSPVILRAVRRQPIAPRENSPNHAGAGQQMLRMDGSALWAATPIAPGTDDNVWLPRPIERLVARLSGEAKAEPLLGTEEPAWQDDVFVGP